MDSFSFHNLQAEKANAILKNRKLRRITGILRFLEVCVVLVLISRLSLRLPVAVKTSSEYFRDLSMFVNNPRFVFLIGNAIIIALFAQSGQFSAQGSRRKDSEDDLYQEFLHNATKKQKVQEKKLKNRAKQGIETEDPIENIKNQEKEGIKSDDSTKNKRINRNMVKHQENNGIFLRKEANFGLRSKGIDVGNNKCDVEKQSMETGEVNNCLEMKKYRRCQTEILPRANRNEQRGGNLRRCETEKKIKAIVHAPTKEEEEEGDSYPEDNMSNEEFRRTIEAFIARQQRLRREEENYSLA
ncbi:hypothetical protein HN51_034354 [Arachis hypogaea]|uniref:DUF4408 domain-containing protein n=1 Tax=Arachis hypogaea TaxID=3818 RepID=A0A445A8L6_ARAHY|nr:uncharacterized protein LOC107628868 [Arachis ipaensis]XP_025642358.1 uncharacterized protein LOC112736903 [Arachis hypogaea]RYR22780.1 hypothetical protein Ahy_B03g068087 [Arachis hypogaea]